VLPVISFVGENDLAAPSDDAQPMSVRHGEPEPRRIADPDPFGSTLGLFLRATFAPQKSQQALEIRGADVGAEGLLSPSLGSNSLVLSLAAGRIESVNSL
jgi:hypothetical protein